MTHRATQARLLGVFVLALGTVWLAAAAGAAQGIDALGLWKADETISLECGQILTPDANSLPVITPIRAKIAIDDAWSDLGTDGQTVRLLMAEAAGLLRGTGMSIMPVEIVRWNPPGA